MNIPSKISTNKYSLEETTAKNMIQILEYGHILNGELKPVSDDLDIVLVQVSYISTKNENIHLTHEIP